MTAVDGLDVVVSGAGIGGMTAAVLLARAGATVTLLERVAEVRAVGAGILLQPNGLAVLTGAGLDGPVRAAGRLVGSVVVRGPAGEPISEFAVPEFGPGLDHHVAVRRSVLHGVLLDAVHAEPRITLQLATPVVAADRRGVVRTGSGAVLSCDLVVGADGARSAVRDEIAFGARVRTSREVYVRGLVPLPDGAAAGEVWTPLGIFGGAPVDAQTHYFYLSATAPAVRDAVAARDLDALRRAWTAQLPAAARVLDAVGSFDELLVNDVPLVRCARFHDGRRVLVGDAAHALAPTSGQGANSALVDAAVLVAALAAAPTADAALARYTARRRRAVLAVATRADLLTRMAHLRSPRTRAVRDRLLRALGTLPGAGERAVRALQQEDPVRLRALTARIAG
ncbi:FAD-dependent oxidoreductase [Pseudonocardia sp. CA-107938]|uniref:FAD-dependent oxidoreductase n=1 Tax=Pseudonocardia sp. CA-107938 TaxID=3240021 RepID=UPI003D907985